MIGSANVKNISDNGELSPIVKEKNKTNNKYAKSTNQPCQLQGYHPQP